MYKPSPTMKTVSSFAPVLLQRAASFCCVACCLLGFACVFGAFGQNRVLQLDGKDSYVQLPSDVFNELTEATVEGWVKWVRFGTWTRFFDFGERNDFGRLGTE